MHALRRVVRRAWDALAASSLLLCVAVGVLWARSYWVEQFVGWSGPVPWFGALSSAGLVRLERGDYAAAPAGWSHLAKPGPAGGSPGLWGEIAARDRSGGPLRRWGFAYADIRYGPGEVRRALYLPHWFLAFLLAIAPALRLRALVRNRRRPPAGRCRRCSYDLRGNQSGVCPECGTATAAVRAAQPT